MTTAQLPVDTLVKIYIKIRDAKSAAKKVFEAEEKILNDKLALIATELKARAQAEGVDGFKAEHGTVFLAETMKTSCADWSAFGEFLKNENPLDWLTNSIKAATVKAYMDGHEGVLPPGVMVFRELEARVRRASES